MFCPKCGRQAPDGARFCEKCGEPLAQPKADPAVQKKQEPVPVKETAQTKEVEQIKAAAPAENKQTDKAVTGAYSAAPSSGNNVAQKTAPAAEKKTEPVKTVETKTEKKPEPVSDNVSHAEIMSADHEIVSDFSFGEGTPSVNTPGPLTVLKDAVVNYFKSFGTIGKNWKQLIPAIILAVIWLLTTILPAAGVNPAPVKLLGFLSFAEAGMSTSPIKIIGGIIGKGMFATALYSLIGIIKRAGKGNKRDPSDLLKQCFGTDINGLWLYLLGAGIATFLFVFMAGNVSRWSFMGGLAAAFLAAKNAVSGGFLSRFVRSIVSSITKKNPGAQSGSLMRGMTSGFALTAVLGMFDNNTLVLIVGAVLLAGGIVLLILDKAGVLKKTDKTNA